MSRWPSNAWVPLDDCGSGSGRRSRLRHGGTCGYLGVLIHTKIEKAAIPANNGHLVLSHPSPVMRDGGDAGRP